MTQTLTKTLTKAQFIAARALAGAYGHLWAGVPDDTLNIDEIYAWSEEHQHPMLPRGIFAPILVPAEAETFMAVHVTGSGRLSWEVRESGNVTLSIFRPADLSTARAYAARILAYAAISSVQASDDESICVARVHLINDNVEEYHFKDDVVFETSDYALAQHNEHAIHTAELRDDLLFHRHVFALIRPIVALLTANEQERPETEDEYQQWRERVIEPAKSKAKKILAPLFAIALPDPLDKNDLPNPVPNTYWTRPEDCFDKEPITVYHNVALDVNESFPVESEKTAVHAVLLLQQQPELPLAEAIKIAVRSKSYRPS